MPPVRVVRPARRASTNAIAIEPTPVSSQPPKLSSPYGASTAGSMNTPDPIMVPTASAQHPQKPISFLLGATGAAVDVLSGMIPRVIIPRPTVAPTLLAVHSPRFAFPRFAD